MLGVDDLDGVISRYADELRAATRSRRLQLGCLVWTSDSYGIGRLVELGTVRARVTFFHSITQREEREYDLDQLGRAQLSLQTRVYVSIDDTQWQMGRVVDHVNQDDQGEEFRYIVRFPNHHELELTESALQVRCLRPTVDPTEVLALGGGETQYFHDRRLAILKTLTQSRQASRGLTGLVSSSIQLIPHQVDIVRRVLEDPIQRYLLADEVGLGKTIEAGVVVRQCLLDNSTGRIIVLAPRSLVRQWQHELEDRFHIGDFGDRVCVRPYSELSNTTEQEWELVIVDEAHRLTSKSRIDDGTYNTLEGLTRRSRRLLLLSATPILGREEPALALLHLLDPVTYRREDIDEFRQRMERRSEYGRCLLTLNSRLPPPILKRNIAKTVEMFPEDGFVGSLAEQANKVGADLSFVTASLRRHIAETYRIHQRLLRTRRRDLEGWELKPRKSEVVIEIDEDPRMSDVWSLLEDWRSESRQTVELLRVTDERDAPRLERRMADRYSGLVDALGRGVEEFALELERQWREVLNDAYPTFAAEQSILMACRQILTSNGIPESEAFSRTSFSGLPVREPSHGTHRLNFTSNVISQAMRVAGPRHGQAVKVVVFSSSPEFAETLYRMLKSDNGPDCVFAVLAGMDSTAIDVDTLRFRDTVHNAVLVCDRTGEEGLNLHFAHTVVHADLPLAPTRIEQRIGRLDRYGRTYDRIYQRVIISSDHDASPWYAWYQLLKQAFCIFDEPVSEIQFVVDKLRQEITLRMYRRSATGLRSITDHVRATLKAERGRLDEQYALDRAAIDDDEAKEVFSALSASDADDSFQRTVNAWLEELLKFRYDQLEDPPSAFKYEWSRRTLLPEWPWKVFVKDDLGRKLTDRRSTAIDYPSIALVRSGFSLVDRIVRSMEWDDRGAAFATWRQEPAWKRQSRGDWLGYRLCFIVEADVQAMVEAWTGNPNASLPSNIRRRADSFLPPWLENVYVDANLNEVIDPVVLKVLERPYEKSPALPGQRDWNLGSLPFAFESIIDTYEFRQLCLKVRERSEQIVRATLQYRDRISRSARRAHDELGAREERLARRNAALQRDTGFVDPTIEQEISINRAIVAGLLTPRVRLDAIGFYVISGATPPGDLGDD